tara:strand:+ start:30 stop:245 length:216 start_codon:yes stop_codon:yes gene_type:complete
MKAVGNWVVVLIEEKKTDSGILTKASNRGRVFDCQCDKTLRDKIVVFNDKLEYTTENNVMYIPYEQIMAVE